MVLCGCGAWARVGDGCPACGNPGAGREPSGYAGFPTSARRAAGAVLMGLAMACSDGVGDDDAQPAYGVPDTGHVDNDGDGWTQNAGDCNDADPAIHPDATETAGDGIDSNCDGADDT